MKIAAGVPGGGEGGFAQIGPSHPLGAAVSRLLGQPEIVAQQSPQPLNDAEQAARRRRSPIRHQRRNPGQAVGQPFLHPQIEPYRQPFAEGD